MHKLNKILYKMDTLENKVKLIEENMKHPVNIDEEFINVQLPIALYEDLIFFDEQLSEEKFKNTVVNIFYCLLFYYY